MDLVALYLANFTEATQRSYSATLKEWSNFVTDPLTASRQDAIKFFSRQLNKVGAKPRRKGISVSITRQTIFRKRIILKAFYSHLEKEGFASAKIFDFPLQAPNQKPIKRPTEPLPLEKVRALLDAPSEFTKDGIRDRGILAMLLFTGCRRQEVINLNLEHIRERADGLLELLSVTTKGGEPMVRIIPKEPSERIGKVVAQRLAEGAKPEAAVFIPYHGKARADRRLEAKWLWRHFKKWCQDAGMPADALSPHSTRVTVVTQLLNEGHDYGSVCAVTGHKSIEVVRRYDARFRAVESSPALKLKY